MTVGTNYEEPLSKRWRFSTEWDKWRDNERQIIGIIIVIKPTVHF